MGTSPHHPLQIIYVLSSNTFVYSSQGTGMKTPRMSMITIGHVVKRLTEFHSIR